MKIESEELSARAHTTPGGVAVTTKIVSSIPDIPPDITRRHVTETEAIREMWKRYEFIINTSRDFMNLIDRDYTYQACNDAFLSTLNKTREETIGKTVADIWGKQTFELDIKPCFDQCFAGNVVQVEFSIDISKRGLSNFSATYYPYYNADKEITHAVVISHDITIRKQTERWLRHIVEGTAKSTGADFFRELVRHVAAATGAKVAFAAELLPEDELQASSLATWTGSDFSQDFTWQLEGTPGANIMSGNTTFFAEGLQQKFPDDTWLSEIGAESYLGIPFMDSAGRIIGHMGIIDDKPMNGNNGLEPILRIFTDRAGAELERQHVEKQLKHMAHHDNLTGLPNRFLFFDRLVQTLAQARRRKESFSVMFMDLDRFKDINDMLGHEMGDSLLKEVAIRLLGCVREADTVARMGGDEFTIILTNTQALASIEKVAEKVLDALTQPFTLSGEERCIGVSIGISVYPSDSESSDVIVRNADTAMYQAKKKGNTFRFYHQGSEIQS